MLLEDVFVGLPIKLPSVRSESHTSSSTQDSKENKNQYHITYKNSTPLQIGCSAS